MLLTEKNTGPENRKIALVFGRYSLMNRLNTAQGFLLTIGKILKVSLLCMCIPSSACCQLLVNTVAGSLAAQSVRKAGGAPKETDEEAYQPPDPAEQSYNYSLFWEERGQLEKAIQEMEKFVKLVPDDPRGPERLQMLKTKLNEKRENETRVRCP